MTNGQLIGIVMPLGGQRGGAESLLRHLLECKQSRHTYICAFLQAGPLADEARDLGYSVTIIPTTHLRDTSNYFATVRALCRWIHSYRPDAVLSWMPKAHLYVAPAALFADVPAMWYQHGTPRGEILDYAVALLPSSKVLCCSEASRQFQDRLFPQQDTIVCHPGVRLSTRKRERQRSREALGLPLQAPIIGVVARLERWKGVHVFVESAKILATYLPDAIFFVVGGAHPRDLPYTEEINDQVEKANLKGRFLLIGQKTATEVAVWQSAADIMVHPATGTEPFGMAVVEAMDAGTPVIASDIAGPAEIITDSVNGLLVPPGNPKAIADTAMRLLRDPDLYSRITSAALDRSRNFSIDVFQTRIDNILSGIGDD